MYVYQPAICFNLTHLISTCYSITNSEVHTTSNQERWARSHRIAPVGGPAHGGSCAGRFINKEDAPSPCLQPTYQTRMLLSSLKRTPSRRSLLWKASLLTMY